jgi:hypothetical protein
LFTDLDHQKAQKLFIIMTIAIKTLFFGNLTFVTKVDFLPLTYPLTDPQTQTLREKHQIFTSQQGFDQRNLILLLHTIRL